MEEWKWNPKTKGSGVITCIPQQGECPNKCDDCFFQSGRSYLEPLKENLPHVPDKSLAAGRVVRMNDGNDSNAERDLVEKAASQYEDYFFNTSIPLKLEEFSGPVVLTVNPAKMTDKGFHKIDPAPDNLMFVRVRVNTWNLDLVREVVKHYTERRRGVPVILTYMAYYKLEVEDRYKHNYEWKKRTSNSYWVIKKEALDQISDGFKKNRFVYACKHEGQHACRFCGNCIREYYNTKERLRKD